MNKKALIFLLPFLLLACTAPRTPTSPKTTSAPLPTQPPPTSTASPPTATGTPVQTVLAPFPPPKPGELVMDGSFEDWAAFDPAAVDPAGDAGPSGVDFTQIYAAHTDSLLLLKVDIGRVVSLQNEPALEISIQGENGQVSYDFGDRRGRIDGRSVKQDAIGVVEAPTVTSDVFEVSFPRDVLPEGDLEITLMDPGTGGDTASLVYSWSRSAAPPDFRTLDRPEGTLRIVSWNVLRDNLFDRDLGEHFARVLQALQPDVILIQEVYIYSEKTALNRITEWLGGEWFARKQGDLVTLSRFPFVDDWRDGNYNLRARIFPSMLDVNGARLVVFNAHLSCCERDEDRQGEVDSLIGFLRQVGLPEGTPFLLGGDLNLVGDAQQLATLLTGDIINEAQFGEDYAPDWDGSTLADLAPRHSHSDFTFTWQDAESSFVPGRLDYLIYSDSVLQARGFVLDTWELPPEVLAAYGLQADDTVEASDHLPVVADILLATEP